MLFCCYCVVLLLFVLFCYSLCCSMYCLCVNVCCTTATVCLPNCSWQIYHIIIFSDTAASLHVCDVWFWNYWTIVSGLCRSQWPRGLSRRSAAAYLLRSWVWIPPGACMFVCCKSCVLSGRGLCDELITRPEESYRLWCVVDLSRNHVNEEALPHWGGGCRAKNKQSIWTVWFAVQANEDYEG